MIVNFNELENGDKPREKAIEKGLNTLSNSELLAIILGTGTNEKDVLELAMEIIQTAGSLQDLAKMTIQDLKKIKGIGPVKAITLMATFELSKRKLEEENESIIISSVIAAVKLFQPKLMDLKYEEFHVAFVNRKLKVIGYKEMFKGGIDSTTVDPKVILKEAMQRDCYGIICAHNHPSGSPDPSEADKKITQKIKNSSEIVDIKFLDHIIIAGNKYYSFAG